MNMKLLLSLKLMFLVNFSLILAMSKSSLVKNQFVSDMAEEVEVDYNETLISGIRFSTMSLIKEALENGVNVNNLYIDKYNPGYSALHLSFQEANLEIIQALLDSGADIALREKRFRDRSCNAIELATYLVGIHHPMRIQPKYKKVLELLQNWQKKLNEEIKKETAPYLIPDLGDIVSDYVV